MTAERNGGPKRKVDTATPEQAGKRLPYKLTPGVLEGICKDVRAGATTRASAVARGISESAYYDWMARGKLGEEPYAAFYKAVEQARAAAERRMAKRLVHHSKAPEGARATIEWLRRRNQKEWEPQTKLEVATKPANQLTDDELESELVEVVTSNPVLASKLRALLGKGES